MGQVVYYVAMSLDGFIADEAGGVEWLEKMPPAGNMGYDKFYESVGAVVMGSATYEQIRSFGQYPYSGVESVVMTKRTLPQPDGGTVTFSQAPLAEVIADLKARHEKMIWMVGGGQLAAAAEDAGVIDLYDVFIMPMLLRRGIPLMAAGSKTRLQHLKPVNHQAFANGVMRLQFAPERS